MTAVIEELPAYTNGRLEEPKQKPHKSPSSSGRPKSKVRIVPDYLYSTFRRSLQRQKRSAQTSEVGSHMTAVYQASLLINSQHLLGHNSVRVTEASYAAFISDDKFKNAIACLEHPTIELKGPKPTFPGLAPTTGLPQTRTYNTIKKRPEGRYITSLCF